jgi:MFS transporter, ACS family, glucarate transporter
MANTAEPNVLPLTTAAAGTTQPPSHVRYWVLVLNFVMFFLMYMDRASMGVAAPSIMRDFGIGKITMGWSASAFTWAYALFQVPGGWMADRLGPRRVLGGVLVWWAAFAAGTGMAINAPMLAATRFLFGMGEAAAFPASSRAIVRWLPATQRAFGQGFQHAGSRLGAALAPVLLVPLIAWTSWRVPFFLFSAAGVTWSALWYFYYRDYPQEHAGVNQGERDILAGVMATRPKVRPPVPWRLILRSRDVWFLCAMYFCYGWGLWMYLVWLPTYLQEVRHMAAGRLGFAASLPMLAATFTNLVGGWSSDTLTRRWGNLRAGRVAVSVAGFTIAAAALVPGVLAPQPWMNVLFLTLALAALELTVAVSWAISIDLGGDFSGSVSALMNTCGSLGGTVSAIAIGYLASTVGWNWPFLVGSALCLVAALLAAQIDPRRCLTAPATKLNLGEVTS